MTRSQLSEQPGPQAERCEAGERKAGLQPGIGWPDKARPGHDAACGYRGRRGRPVLLGMVIAVAAAAVYANTLHAPLQFDDGLHISESRSIRQLWPPWGAMAGTARPLLMLTLAINYAISGLQTWSYHVVNIGLHAAAAVVLFGLLRRTLAAVPRFGGAADPLAAAAALLWAVHPIQTQAVSYIIQRGESMTGLFYLLTLYTAARGMGSGRPAPWYVAAGAACAAGMATKEVMATAPLMVLLYDRTFAAGSLRGALRRRWALYAGLAASWLLLAGLFMFNLRVAPRSAGFGVEGVGPLAYAASQPGVILRYLGLAVWPSPLCFDYRWPLAGHWSDVLLPAAAVAALLAAGAVCLWRRQPIGWAAAFFFLVLAPTSTIVPIRDVAVEHRMYLPLAAVMVSGAAGGWLLLLRLRAAWGLRPALRGTNIRTVDRRATEPRAARRSAAAGPPVDRRPPVMPAQAAEHGPAAGARRLGWLAGGAVLVIAACLAAGTVRRNTLYNSERLLWEDAVRRRPQNARAHFYVGIGHTMLSQHAESLEWYRRAVELDPDFVEAHTNYGNALLILGQPAQAMAEYREALALNPGFLGALLSMGKALGDQGRFDEATALYREALARDPRRPEAHTGLAAVYLQQKRLEPARVHLEQALAIEPESPEALYHAGLLNALSGDHAAAARLYARSAELYERSRAHFQAYLDARHQYANALVRSGRTAEAIAEYRAVLALRPQWAQVHNNLGVALMGAGERSEARRHFEEALRLEPHNARARQNLNNLLSEQ